MQHAFTETGIELESGEVLAADIVITATGLGKGYGGPLIFEDIGFDLGRGELFRGHARVRLTDVERSLLASLAEAADAALTREDLVSGSAVNGNMRTIDVQITRLRRKIESDPKFPRYLQTVRGKGYMLRTEG